MAKAKAQPIQRARPAHRADPERLTRLLIIGSVVGAILIAVGVVAFGYYQTQVKPLGGTVLTVGTMKYNLGELERRMRMEIDVNASNYNSQSALLNMPDNVMEQLTVESKILQKAGDAKVTVTDEEITKYVNERGGIAADADPKVFANVYRQQVKDSHLHEGEYRDFIKANLLAQKLSDLFTYAAPTKETQVQARWMALDTKPKADAALARINGGEDFVKVGDEVALDKTSVDRGTTDEDWLLRGFLPNDQIEKYVFDDGKPGQVSAVISVDNLYYVVQVVAREEDRTLTDTQRPQVGTRELQKWLDGLDITVEKSLSNDERKKAFDDIS